MLEVSAERRATATQVGLHVLDPAQSDPNAFVDEWTGGAGADVAFEVSGSAAGVEAATQVLAVRGRLVMVAIHSTPREVDLFRVFWRELVISGPGSTNGPTSKPPPNCSMLLTSPPRR